MKVLFLIFVAVVFFALGMSQADAVTHKSHVRVIPKSHKHKTVGRCLNQGKWMGC